MKAFVDKDACIGCGLCESICPRVFRINSEGVAEVILDEIPSELEDEVRDAESQCPVEAIKVE